MNDFIRVACPDCHRVFSKSKSLADLQDDKFYCDHRGNSGSGLGKYSNWTICVPFESMYVPIVESEFDLEQDQATSLRRKGMSSTAMAVLFASGLHSDQKDRDGSLHFSHLQRVASMVPEDCKAVAWLHDILEDTDAEVAELRDLGLSTEEIRAIDALSRTEGEPYASYIERIVLTVGAAGIIARRVKEADLIDNLSRCLRGEGVTPKSQTLSVRYRAALPRIQMAMLGRPLLGRDFRDGLRL